MLAVNLQALERGYPVIGLDQGVGDLANRPAIGQAGTQLLRRSQRLAGDLENSALKLFEVHDAFAIARQVAFGLQSFAVNLVEGGDAIVPFQQRCCGAGQFDGARI